MVDVLTPKFGKLGTGFSRKAIIAASEDYGRPWNRPAGGWVSDLTALQKFVMLCPFCGPKFNPKKADYEVWRTNAFHVGKCDGCKELSTYLCGYIHQEHHPIVGEWQRKPPRRGRWAK